MRPAGARWAATRRRWCRPPAVGRPAARRQAGEQVGGCALGTALRELKQLDRQVLQRLVTAAEARRVTMRTPSSGWSERGWFTGCSLWRPLAYHWAVTPIGDRSRCTRWTSVCSARWLAPRRNCSSTATTCSPSTAGRWSRTTWLSSWRPLPALPRAHPPPPAASTSGAAPAAWRRSTSCWNAVLPLEVRAGINPRSKSLQSFDSQFSAPGLVHAVLDWARRKDARAVYLTVTCNNDTAVTFYRSLGFSFTGRVTSGKVPLRGNVMRFVYPARLRRTGPDEVVVSFRDLPECLTSGADETEALAEAADALDVAIAGRIVYPPANGDPIPVPSARRTDEHDVAVPADTAAKAALMLALRESGLSRSAFARRLGVDVKVVRRMLDPRHRTAASRIGAALHELGRELVVETHVPEPVR